MAESIDSKVLAALHLMSKNTDEGVNYMEFVKQDIMTGALDLIVKGYARKIPIGIDNSNYCLTPEGVKYLEKIVKYAQKEF